jgi:hypothetical protein
MIRWNSFTERKRHIHGKVFSFFEKIRFDVVDPCEWLQVEVAGGLVKHRHNQYVRTMSSPLPLS